MKYDTPCRRNVQMSVPSKLDGVTGRQPNVVAGVAVPQSDGVGNHGVRLVLLQASSRDDHGALCWYRRVIGKREPVRCRRDRTDRPRGQGGQRARRPDRVVPRGGVLDYWPAPQRAGNLEAPCMIVSSSLFESYL